MVYALFLCACRAVSCVSVTHCGACSGGFLRHGSSRRLPGGRGEAAVCASPVGVCRLGQRIGPSPAEPELPRSLVSARSWGARPGPPLCRAGWSPEEEAPVLLVEGSSPRQGHGHPPPTTHHRARPAERGLSHPADARDPSFARAPRVTQGRHREEAVQAEGSEQRRWEVTSERGDGRSTPKTRGTRAWRREGGARHAAGVCARLPTPTTPRCPRGASIWPRSPAGTRLERGHACAVPGLPAPASHTKSRGRRRGRGRDGSGGLRGTQGRLELCPLRCLPPPDPHVSLHATEDGLRAAGLPRALQPPASHLQPGSQ